MPREVAVIKVVKNGDTMFVKDTSILNTEAPLVANPHDARHFVLPEDRGRLIRHLVGINHPGAESRCYGGISVDAPPQAVLIRFSYEELEVVQV